MKKIIRKLLWPGIAFHFLVVILSITHIQERLCEKSAVIDTILSFYSQASYAVIAYPFFAPKMEDGYEVYFDLYQDEVFIKRIGLPMENQEVRVMMNSLEHNFDVSEATQDLYARSWALYLLNKYPTISMIKIQLFRVAYPTMSEFKQGHRLTQKPHYQTTIKLK